MDTAQSTSTLTPLSDLIAAYRIPDIKGQTSLTEYQEMRATMLNDERIPAVNGVECEICGNKGIIYYVREDAICGRECECMPRRRANAALLRCGFTGDMLDMSFDNYTTAQEWQARAAEKARKYAESDCTDWLFFSGQNGSGKTHLCTAVCKMLIDKGITVVYLIWDELRQRLEANRYNEEGYNKIIREIKGAEVLYIDDFLKTEHRSNEKPAPPTKEDMKAAFAVINARYMVKKRTIISTEHIASEIIDYDTAVGGRIQQRSNGYMIQIDRAAGRDYRLYRHKGG